MHRGKSPTGIELYRKTKIHNKNMFAGERSRVVVYLFLKTVANDSGTCVAKSHCKTLMPEIDK